MRVIITCEATIESGIGDVIGEISGSTSDHFQKKSYGNGVKLICVVVSCLNPEYNHKQRIRFIKKSLDFYVDIMLHLPDVIPLTYKERRNLVLNRILLELPPLIKKYKFKDFDQYMFLKDLGMWFKESFLEHEPKHEKSDCSLSEFMEAEFNIATIIVDKAQGERHSKWHILLSQALREYFKAKQYGNTIKFVDIAIHTSIKRKIRLKPELKRLQIPVTLDLSDYSLDILDVVEGLKSYIVENYSETKVNDFDFKAFIKDLSQFKYEQAI